MSNVARHPGMRKLLGKPDRNSLAERSFKAKYNFEIFIIQDKKMGDTWKRPPESFQTIYLDNYSAYAFYIIHFVPKLR